MRQLRHLPSGCIPNQIDLISHSSSHLAYSTSKLTYLFNPENLAFSQVVNTAEKPITSICFNPLNASQYVSISSDCKITQWNGGSTQPWVDGHYAVSECTLQLPDIPIFCEYSSAENGLVAVLQRNGKIIMCSMNAGNVAVESISPTNASVSAKKSSTVSSHSRTSSLPNNMMPVVTDKLASSVWGESLQKWPGIAFVTSVENAACLRWLPGETQTLLVGSMDGSISVLQRGSVVSIMQPPKDLVNTPVRDIVLCSEQPNTILTLYGKSGIVSYTVDTASVNTVYRPQPGFVNSLCPLPNFSGFLSCTNNSSTVQVWNFDSDHPVDTIHLSFLCDDVGVSHIFAKQGATASNTLLEYNNTSVQEQTLVYMVLTDGSIRLIEIPSLREIARTLVFQSSSLITCDEQNGMLAVCSADGHVRIWNSNTLQCESLVANSSITNQLNYNVLSTKGDTYNMYTSEDPLQGTPGLKVKYGVRTGCVDTHKYDSFAVSLSEEALCVTGVHKHLPLTDEMEEKAISQEDTVVRPDATAVSVAFHPSDATVLLACQQTVQVRKQTGEVLVRLQVPCTQAQFLPSNPQLILTANAQDSFLTVTEVSGVTQQRIPHPMAISAFDTVSSLPSIVAVGCMDHKIYLWDLSAKIAKSPVLVLTGHSAPITCINWAKGVRGLLATAAADNSVRVWDVLSGSCVSVCTVPATVTSVLLHSELPHVLITGDINGTISAYDIRDSSLLFSSTYHLDAITKLISTAPLVILSIGKDGGVKEWSLTSTLLRGTYICAALQGKLDASFISDPITVLRSQPTPDFLLCHTAKQLLQDLSTTTLQDLPNVTALHNFFSNPYYAQEVFQLASKIEKPTESLSQFASNAYIHGSMSIVNNPVNSHINDVRAHLWSTARSILHDIDPVKLTNTTNHTSSAAAEPITLLTSPTSRSKKLQKAVIEPVPTKKLNDFPAPAPKLVTNVADRERLVQAAECFLQLGSMYEYCQVLIRLGQWERAMALAPCVTPAYWKQVLLQYQDYLRSKHAPAALPFTLATGDSAAYSSLLLRQNQNNNHNGLKQSTGNSVVNKNEKYVSHTHPVESASDAMPIAIADYLGVLPLPVRDEVSLKADQQEMTEFLATEAEKEATDMKCDDIGTNDKIMEVIAARVSNDCVDALGKAKELLRVNEPEKAVQFLLEADEVELAISLVLGLDLVSCDHVWRAAAAKCEALSLYDEALECLLRIEDPHANDVLLLCARFQGSNARKYDLFVKAGLKAPTDYAREGLVMLQNLKEAAVPLQKQSKGRPNKAAAAVTETGESLQAKVQCLFFLVAGGKTVDAATIALQWINEAYSKPVWSFLEIEAFLLPLQSLHLASLQPKLKHMVLAHLFFGASVRALALQYTSIAPFLFNTVTRAISASTQHGESSPEDTVGAFPVSNAQRHWLLAQGVAAADPVTAYLSCTEVLNDQGLAASSKIRSACAGLKRQLESLPVVQSLVIKAQAVSEDEKTRARSPPATNSAAVGVPQWQASWGEVVVTVETGALTVTATSTPVKNFAPVGANLSGAISAPYFAAHYAPIIGTVTADKVDMTATKLFGKTLSPQAFAESKVISTYGEVFSTSNFGKNTCLAYGKPKAITEQTKLISIATGKQVGANPVVLEDGTSLVSRTEALMLREVIALSPILSGQHLRLA